MKKLICTVLAACMSLTGCAATKAVFTNPTGNITIERQEFINTYAVVKVLYKQLRANFQGTPEELAAIDQRAKALDIQIQAKIEVPESEIDWAVVKEMLSVLVGLVP